MELMNAKAAELGLAGTHFVNANGLHSADHYTTPYDMARLTQWAMTVPGFSELFGATSYTCLLYTSPAGPMPAVRPECAPPSAPHW